MKNRIAVLTGAAGGMGSAVRDLLEKNGFTVWSLDIADLSCERYIRTDITDENSLAQALLKIKEEAGSIDAIIHTAGIYNMNSLVEMTHDELMQIFKVNFFAMASVNRIFLPLLNHGSRIVMVSSELAPLDPLPFTGIYGITKSTVEKYAYSLRMELQLLGYKVSVIRPGAVKTGFLGQSQRRIEEFCNRTELYKDTSKRFLGLVNSIETANVEPSRIAEIILKALNANRPRYVYNINRSPLLRLLNAMPQRLQNYVIKRILTKEKN
jgi:short-subunit dehydrogenase